MGAFLEGTTQFTNGINNHLINKGFKAPEPSNEKGEGVSTIVSGLTGGNYTYDPEKLKQSIEGFKTSSLV